MPRFGKISASSLNGKDFAALIPQIDGGYLIIDKAGELNRETALRMSQLMEQNTRGMVILLEDTRAGIRKAMQLDFGFAKKFTEKVDIPIFTIDELVEFGKSYAKEMECTIDQMGYLLYTIVSTISKNWSAQPHWPRSRILWMRRLKMQKAAESRRRLVLFSQRNIMRMII